MIQGRTERTGRADHNTSSSVTFEWQRRAATEHIAPIYRGVHVHVPFLTRQTFPSLQTGVASQARPTSLKAHVLYHVLFLPFEVQAKARMLWDQQDLISIEMDWWTVVWALVAVIVVFVILSETFSPRARTDGRTANVHRARVDYFTSGSTSDDVTQGGRVHSL